MVIDPKQFTVKSEEYLRWVRKQECLICGKDPPSDPHHVRHANRNDFLAISLCRKCHGAYHNLGHQSFESFYSVDLNWTIILSLIRYIQGLKSGV